MKIPKESTSDELLNVLYYSPNATAIYCGDDITILNANEVMLSFWGKTSSIIGQNFQDALPGLNGQPFLGILKEVWQTGQTFLAKNYAADLMVNGSYKTFYFDFEYKAIKGSDDKMRYILHTAFEVSDRMAAVKTINEKSISEQKLIEDLSAMNEEYIAINEQLSDTNNDLLKSNLNLQQSQEEVKELISTLIESENRFRLLVERAPIAIGIYCGDEMIIEQANNEMFKIWGRDKTILGLPLLVARPELEGHEYIKIIQEVFRSGRSHMGYSIKAPVFREGRLKEGFFDVNYKLLPENNTKQKRIIIIANDVTEKTLIAEREKAMIHELSVINEKLTYSNNELIESQNQLKQLLGIVNEREERFRTMIEYSPVAIGYFKGDNLIVDAANEALLRILEIDRSIIGLPLPVSLHNSTENVFSDILIKVMNSGDSYYGKEIKVNIHNTEGYFNVVYRPINRLNENEKAILVVAYDVTEEVNGRRRVDEVNTRLQIAMDVGGLGATQINLKTGEMSSDDQFKMIYGFQPDQEFSYHDLFKTVLPQKVDLLKTLVKESIRNKTVYKMEFPIRWPDGTLHWVQAQGRSIYSTSGEPEYMVGMAGDITEKKLFEQKKDDFLSTASHELKTPITALKASIQFLDRIKDKPYSSTHTKLIEQSVRSVEKISILVDELLNVTRISEGQLELKKTEFNLYQMVMNSSNNIQKDDDYEIIFLGNKELIVHADESRIDQVVVNLINNAIKYAPLSRKLHVIIEKDNHNAIVKIKDFGEGIDREILPYLFERYYRADHSGKVYSGLGLGLYICSEIIKKHGGQIGAESEAEKGSVFWFSIPTNSLE
ncbi:ATP-binding protein [Chryseobacterium sp. C39-AII1]|uniref:PAS domain-containing sensor histidine kinase n=1 Tax=Chryseobacterium sp. C39-AII1 TaxID=3080332 RepID=UPI003209C81E